MRSMKVLSLLMLILIIIQSVTPIIGLASLTRNSISNKNENNVLQEHRRSSNLSNENRTLALQSEESLIRSTPTLRKVIVMSKECEIGLVKPFTSTGTIAILANLNGSYIRHKESVSNNDLNEILMYKYIARLNDLDYIDEGFIPVAAASSNLNKDALDELFTIYVRCEEYGGKYKLYHGPVIYWNLTAINVEEQKAGAMHKNGKPYHSSQWPPSNLEDYLTGLDSCKNKFMDLKILIGDFSGDRFQDYGVTAYIHKIYSKYVGGSKTDERLRIYRYASPYFYKIDPSCVMKTPTGNYNVQIASQQNPKYIDGLFKEIFLIDIDRDGVKEIAGVDRNFGEIVFFKLENDSLEMLPRYTVRLRGKLNEAWARTIILGADAGDLDRDLAEEIVILYATLYPVTIEVFKPDLTELRFYNYIWDMAYAIDIIDLNDDYNITYTIFRSCFDIPEEIKLFQESLETFYVKSGISWKIYTKACGGSFTYHDFICHPMRGPKLIVTDVDGDGYEDIVFFYEDRKLQAKKFVRCTRMFVVDFNKAGKPEDLINVYPPVPTFQWSLNYDWDNYGGDWEAISWYPYSIVNYFYYDNNLEYYNPDMYLNPDDDEACNWKWDLDCQSLPLWISDYAMIDKMKEFSRKACILFSRLENINSNKRLKFDRLTINLETESIGIISEDALRQKWMKPCYPVVGDFDGEGGAYAVLTGVGILKIKNIIAVLNVPPIIKGVNHGSTTFSIGKSASKGGSFAMSIGAGTVVSFGLSFSTSLTREVTVGTDELEVTMSRTFEFGFGTEFSREVSREVSYEFGNTVTTSMEWSVTATDESGPIVIYETTTYKVHFYTLSGHYMKKALKPITPGDLGIPKWAAKELGLSNLLNIMNTKLENFKSIIAVPLEIAIASAPLSDVLSQPEAFGLNDQDTIIKIFENLFSNKRHWLVGHHIHYYPQDAENIIPENFNIQTENGIETVKIKTLYSVTGDGLPVTYSDTSWSWYQTHEYSYINSETYSLSYTQSFQFSFTETLSYGVKAELDLEFFKIGGSYSVSASLGMSWATSYQYSLGTTHSHTMSVASSTGVTWSVTGLGEYYALFGYRIKPAIYRVLLKRSSNTGYGDTVKAPSKPDICFIVVDFAASPNPESYGAYVGYQLSYIGESVRSTVPLEAVEFKLKAINFGRDENVFTIYVDDSNWPDNWPDFQNGNLRLNLKVMKFHQ
ncbi:MAG: hypothetical protein DRJ21_00485 [Candidatus Methanomethylicota archaeon]|uniref:Uncharacterized protein n=1 Tax=Thermoproteota archaeon TaxID=2056631 RepID=A0A497EVM3_9CREN|nr:MAG: hypothetical protein DRJ21_00485 [Candidatus Verstraetearchaeota archaeon]